MRTFARGSLLFVLLSLGMCGEAYIFDGSFFHKPDLVNPITYSKNIQKDLLSLGCVVSGCHDKNSTNRLRIDVAYGNERSNYQSLFTNSLVIKGDPQNSPLITVPGNAVTVGNPPVQHIRSLLGLKRYDWEDWITLGALF